jgi:hypothetical protein
MSGDDGGREMLDQWGPTTELYNNGLHQTGRGGVLASRAVVEARPAGEAECSTDATGSPVA